MSEKTIIYNDDGWSTYMRSPAPMSADRIVRRTVGPVAGTAVRVYQFCALGGHAVNYNSTFLPRVGEMMDAIDTMHVWRMRETLRALEAEGTDPLHVVSRACRQHDIDCQFSLRMNDAHHTYRKRDGSWYFPELQSPWLDEHPELLLDNRTLDYAQPAVHQYRQRQIREILDRYEHVAGIDLDFTRFQPWFRPGHQEAGRPLMTQLIRDLRAITRQAGRTLSARFEYDPHAVIASGLDVETWLDERLLDQITLGVTGDHAPDSPSRWWIDRAHRAGCRVFPGIEGQLHWIASCGTGGAGLHPGNGVEDGFGPPSMPYMRAVAANHYADGADGLSLFNFTCADGPFPRQTFTELAEPSAMAFGDKQYVAAVWPSDHQIYQSHWTSRFRLAPDEPRAAYPLRIADDLPEAQRRDLAPSAVLTLDLMGLSAIDDVEIRVNDVPLAWNGDLYNHYDHGGWNDVVRFDAPTAALRQGENAVTIHRLKDNPGFSGNIEVRKCVLEIRYRRTFCPGTIQPPAG